MPALTLRLLGSPRVSTPEDPDLRLPTRKSQALLVYLASPPGLAHAREELSGLLWSRSGEDQARASLRQHLTRLRKVLGPASEAIKADAGQIELVGELVETDISRFEKLAVDPDPGCLEAAAELLRGEFAAGLNLNEGPFEEWISNERLRVSALATGAFVRLLRIYEEREDFEGAAGLARKLLVIDPLEERAHQCLMRALASQERFESALQQYKLCREVLRKELNIEPGEDTTALRKQIARRRQAAREAADAPAVESDGLLRALHGKAPAVGGLRNGLPPQLQGLDLTVPERPSIVIVPFRNLTGDADQDYLAEGIRIDIQAALVKITGIFLIAPGSANALRSADARRAGAVLGVRNALQGSIRRAGKKLRISAELIDVEGGNAIWTESYDRLFDDGFDVQDEIVEEIITALDVRLLGGEQAKVWHKTLKDRDALENFYKGVQEFFKLRKDSNLRARRFFQIVEKKQPAVAIGATWVAMCHWFDRFKGWGDDPDRSLKLAGLWAAKAAAMPDADGQAHMVLSHVHLINLRFDDALVVGREAIILRPNCTNANGFFANVLHYCGEQDDAVKHATWAIRYSPVYPTFFADILALAYLLKGNHRAASAVAGEVLRLNHEATTTRVVLAAACAAGERIAEARKLADQISAADKAFSLRRFADQQLYRSTGDLEKLLGWLNLAGLPA